jgi:hypothetical protein
VSAVTIEGATARGQLLVSRLALFDEPTHALTSASLVAAFVSDTTCFSEAARTPAVRLFELSRSAGRAHVVAGLEVLQDDDAVRRALERPRAAGLDLSRVALATQQDATALALPGSTRSSPATAVSGEGNRLDVSAAGPGLLVVAESWDPGWTAQVDGRPSGVLRVNHAQIGIVLSDGPHSVSLRHRAQGITLGLVLAALALAGLMFSVWHERRAATRES